MVAAATFALAFSPEDALPRRSRARAIIRVAPRRASIPTSSKHCCMRQPGRFPRLVLDRLRALLPRLGQPGSSNAHAIAGVGLSATGTCAAAVGAKMTWPAGRDAAAPVILASPEGKDLHTGRRLRRTVG